MDKVIFFSITFKENPSDDKIRVGLNILRDYIGGVSIGSVCKNMVDLKKDSCSCIALNGGPNNNFIARIRLEESEHRGLL